MSAANCIRTTEGLAVFTDGATYDPDGVIVGITSKVLILPHVPAVITSRGRAGLLPKIYAIAHACGTFESLLAAVQSNAQLCEGSEVMIAGYSRAREAFDICLLPGHDGYAALGMPAKTLARLPNHCFLPGVNLAPPDATFDADRDGIELMECQRRDRQEPYGFCIGGFIQRTDIGRDGISTRIVKWWPDEIGRKIEPARESLNGNHLTFITEQGKFGKLMSSVANWRATEGEAQPLKKPAELLDKMLGTSLAESDFATTKIGAIQPFKLILPFTHIPGQILRAGLEQTPAAFLDANMRADLLGKNGAVCWVQV